MAGENPIKLCECGCGKPTPLAKQTRRNKGHIKGQPLRYISGHNFATSGHYRLWKEHPLTFRSWSSMHYRCNATPEQDHKWAWYAGRGITVCNRWKDFNAFLADMGERPIGTSLDRINPRGNYEPGNCRWATQLEQQNNRSDSVRITARGQTLTIAQWARLLGMNPETIGQRARKGEVGERCLRPPDKPYFPPRRRL